MIKSKNDTRNEFSDLKLPIKTCIMIVSTAKKIWAIDRTSFPIWPRAGSIQLVSLDNNWAVTCVFQQCGILTSVDSDEPVQPALKFSNPKWRSVSSLIFIEYSSDYHRLWSECAYAQADLRLCWTHIPHCLKSHVAAQLFFCFLVELENQRGPLYRDLKS